MQIGTVVMAAGAAVLALTIHLAGIDVGAWQLAPGLALVGVGMGLTMAPFFDIVLAGVEPHETGSASGTLTGVARSSAAPSARPCSARSSSACSPISGSSGRRWRSPCGSRSGCCCWTFALSYLLPRRARPEQQPHGA
ncbi:hypothetical protein GCM10020220_062340 [Nonomuraea rubra]|uniref:hypothetical protein n=1 Tax=Nonomuraea rubra TaxID=46180 RepID=UPI0031EFD0E5